MINLNDVNYSTDVEYENNEKKKFQITRGMVILGVLVLVILIIIIIVVLNIIRSDKKEKYTTFDFNKLESRMIEEAPTYILQKQIVLTDEQIRIDLSDLLLENGGFIDSSKVKAAKICEGYVLASKKETEEYSSYIKCGDKYTTAGYVSGNNADDKTTTTTVKDVEPPTITLIGEDELVINVGDDFDDPGAKATDNMDGDITSKINKSGTVNAKKPGTYVINYEVSDKAGNKSTIKRTVKVVPTATTTKTTSKSPSTTKATTKSNGSTTNTRKTTRRPTSAPTITLYGSKVITINVGDRYNDPGYSAIDSLGSNITSNVRVTGNVNTGVVGTYYITYTVTDNYGNKASATRTIIVKSTTIPLSGIALSPNAINMTIGQSKTITVYYTPTNATDKTISWSSENPSVATISNGIVYARSRGTTVITAKASNGKKASVRVTVK